jgi:hypothetical protein
LSSGSAFLSFLNAPMPIPSLPRLSPDETSIRQSLPSPLASCRSPARMTHLGAAAHWKAIPVVRRRCPYAHCTNLFN